MAAMTTTTTTTTTTTSRPPLEPCPLHSKNCIFTTWTLPSDTNNNNSSDNNNNSSSSTPKARAIQAVKSVLESYPQEGQDEIDLGGWALVEDDGDYFHVEFKSRRSILTFLLNRGKPFVDDLLIQVDDHGTVQIRSSSRVGTHDLGVNQKRVAYLAQGMAKLGWNTPPVDYN